jgi:hypothetical protein
VLVWAPPPACSVDSIDSVPNGSPASLPAYQIEGRVVELDVE